MSNPTDCSIKTLNELSKDKRQTINNILLAIQRLMEFELSKHRRPK